MKSRSKGQLFAFVSHGSPTVFGTGSESEARALCSIMNHHRAINPIVAQAVTEAEPAPQASSAPKTS